MEPIQFSLMGIFLAILAVGLVLNYWLCQIAVEIEKLRKARSDRR